MRMRVTCSRSVSLLPGGGRRAGGEGHTFAAVIRPTASSSVRPGRRRAEHGQFSHTAPATTGQMIFAACAEHGRLMVPVAGELRGCAAVGARTPPSMLQFAMIEHTRACIFGLLCCSRGWCDG